MSAAAPDGLDPLLMDLTRLTLAGLLAATEWAEFPVVRDALAVSDSALSKQAAALEKAGYLETRKGYVGKRPRTWLRLSRDGRRRLRAHADALQRIATASTAVPEAAGPAGAGTAAAGPA